MRILISCLGFYLFLFASGLASAQKAPEGWTPISGMISPEMHAIISLESSLFAGAEDGLYQSVDGGVSWAHVGGGLPQVRILRLVKLDRRLVVQADSNRYWFSDDVGITWSVWNHPTGNPFSSQEYSSDTGYIHIHTAIPLSDGFLIGSGSYGHLGVSKYQHNGLDFQLSPKGLDSNTVNLLIRSGNAILAVVDQSRQPPRGGSFVMISNNEGQSWFKPTGPVGEDEFIHSFIAMGSKYFASGIHGRLYVSNDYGLSWRLSSFAMVTESFTPEVMELSAFPNGNIMAWNYRDIFVSEDMGTTWSMRRRASGPHYSQTLAQMGNTIIISDYSAILLSRDGGKNWEPRSLPTEDSANYSLSTVSGKLWAATSTYLFVSQDTGLTWVNANTLPSALPGNEAAAGMRGDSTWFFTGQGSGPSSHYSPNGGWEWTLSGAHPRINCRVQKGAQIWVGTNIGVFESRDSGIRWTPRNRRRNAEGVFFFGDTSISALEIQGDSLYAGGLTGLYVKRLSDSVWTKIPGVSHSVTRIVVEDSVILASGMPTYSGWSISNNHGRTWKFIVGSNGFNSLHSGTDITLRNGILVATTGSGIYRSGNIGATWEWSGKGLWPGKIPTSAYLWSFISHGSSLWVGIGMGSVSLGAGLYRSLDSGSSWSPVLPVSSAFPFGPDSITSVKPASSGNRLFVILGTNIWITGNNGITWSNPEGGWSKDIRIGPIASDSMVCVLTESGRILVMGNRDTAWNAIPLPNPGDTNTVLSMTVVGSRIIAGRGKTLYLTDDLGQTWTPKATSCGNAWYMQSLGSRVSAQSAACSTQSILLWLSMDSGTSWQDVSKNPIIGTLKGRVYTGVESKAFYIGSLENIPHNNPIRGPYMEYKNTRYRSPDGVQWVMDSPYPRPLVNVELGSRLYTTEGGYIYYQEKGPTTAINNSRLVPGSLKATTTEFTYLGSNGILRRFEFQTSQSGSMEILSIEATGRMRTLLNRKILGPGSHEFQFNIPIFTNQFILAKWNGQIYRLQTRK